MDLQDGTQVGRSKRAKLETPSKANVGRLTNVHDTTES